MSVCETTPTNLSASATNTVDRFFDNIVVIALLSGSSGETNTGFLFMTLTTLTSAGSLSPRTSFGGLDALGDHTTSMTSVIPIAPIRWLWSSTTGNVFSFRPFIRIWAFLTGSPFVTETGVVLIMVPTCLRPSSSMLEMTRIMSVLEMNPTSLPLRTTGAPLTPADINSSAALITVMSSSSFGQGIIMCSTLAERGRFLRNRRE